MDSEWTRVGEALKSQYPELYYACEFDVNDQVNYVINGLTRNTFHKERLWKSNDNTISWRRVGMGIFDFRLVNSRIELPDIDDVVVLSMDVGDDTVIMECVVLEMHLQTKEEIGEGEGIQHSTVVGRGVLALRDVWINRMVVA